MTSESFKYYAFISYSRKDEKVARWIHHKLENYSVPRRIQNNEHIASRKPFFPSFIDEEELSSSISLTELIESALINSKFLVVICSKDSSHSQWVNEEIQRFKRMGREKKIISVIYNGDPNGKDEDRCFPESLFQILNSNDAIFDFKDQPLGINFRFFNSTQNQPNIFLQYSEWIKTNNQRKEGLLKIVADLLQIEFAELKQRDIIRRRWRYSILSLVIFLFTVIGSLLLKNAIEAEKKANRIRYEKHFDALHSLELNSSLYGNYAQSALCNLELWQLDVDHRKITNNDERLEKMSFFYSRIPKYKSYHLVDSTEQILIFYINEASCLLKKNDSIFVMDLRTFDQRFLKQFDDCGNFRWLNWNKTLQRIVFLNNEMKLQSWNLTEDVIEEAKEIQGFSFAPSKSFYAYQKKDHSLYIQKPNGKAEEIVLGENAVSFQFSFTQSGNILIVTSRSNGTKLTMIKLDEAGEVIDRLILKDWGGDEPFVISRWVLCGDESKIACRSINGDISIFSTKTGERLFGPYVAPNNEFFDDYFFSPDGNRLYLTRNNHLDVWELKEPFNAYTAINFQSEITSFSLNKDGSQLLIASGNQLYLYFTVNWSLALSPIYMQSSVSKLSFFDNNNVFIGTNHGEYINISLPDNSKLIRCVWTENKKIEELVELENGNYKAIFESNALKQMAILSPSINDEYKFQLKMLSPESDILLKNGTFLTKDKNNNIQVCNYSSEDGNIKTVLELLANEYPAIPKWQVSDSGDWLVAILKYGI